MIGQPKKDQGLSRLSHNYSQLNQKEMDSGPPAPIALHGSRCMRYFDQLRLLLQDSDPQMHAGISYSAVCDELGRFRIWAGNIGALQDKQSSLDFRLRDAPRISDQVVELLQDLSESLEEGSSSVLRLYCKKARLTALVCAVASGKRPNRFSVESETVEENLMLDFNRDVVSGEFMPTSELEELFASTEETITSLFKISIVIRNATCRDRYTRAMAAAKEPLDDSFDISHVGHKFPHIHKTPWLEKRLGRAIAQRRQYMKYSKEHHDKLSSGMLHDQETQYSKHGMNKQVQLSQKEGKAPSTLSSTKASTLAATLLNKTADLSDEDQRSVTSYATSFGEDSGKEKMRVPPPPEKVTTGMPFECPYCREIQMLKDVNSWKLVTLSC